MFSPLSDSWVRVQLTHTHPPPHPPQVPNGEVIAIDGKESSFSWFPINSRRKICGFYIFKLKFSVCVLATRKLWPPETEGDPHVGSSSLLLFISSIWENNHCFVIGTSAIFQSRRIKCFQITSQILQSG